MSTAVLFMTAKNQNHYPSIRKWNSKLWCFHIRKYYSIIRKNKLLYVSIWINPPNTMLKKNRGIVVYNVVSFWCTTKWISHLKWKSLSCVWLFATPMDCSPPGSSVHGILQARMLEEIAIPFSRGSSQPKDGTQVSHIAGGFFAV